MYECAISESLACLGVLEAFWRRVILQMHDALLCLYMPLQKLIGRPVLLLKSQTFRHSMATRLDPMLTRKTYTFIVLGETQFV